MDIFANLAMGFAVALTPMNFFYCLIGVTLGTFIGVLPGVGPLIAIAVLLPLTFGLPPEGSLIMLAGIYYGAAYGGSTTAILVNLPGESSSVVTCIDGHQMARQGRAGPALAIAALSSFFAGCVGTVLIAVAAPPLTLVALQFGPAEYFSLMLTALILTAALVHGSLLKGIGMALFGIILGTVGTDVNTGMRRFTFGMPGLAEGINFVVLAVGIFAIGEIIATLESGKSSNVQTHKVGRIMPTMTDFMRSIAPTIRGTAIGSFLGLLPGAGQSIATFAAYLGEKRLSRNRAELGSGAIEGVASPEAANNAAAQTSFIPTLTLGVPGSPTMALMLGALMIQGIAPGPQVIVNYPTLFWGLIASMWIGNLLLVVLNLPMAGLWVKLLRVPYRWLFPGIVVFSCVGVYATSSNLTYIWFVAGLGVVGYVVKKLDCEPAPFVLGFILGPIMEENFRRAMLMSRGNPEIFVREPVSAAFLVLAVLIVIAMVIPALRRKKDIVVADVD